MVASRLQIATLTEAAVNAIADRMTPDFCLDWMALGDKLQLSALTLKAKECAVRSFADASKTSGFVTLPAPLLEQILECQVLRVDDESGVSRHSCVEIDCADRRLAPHGVTESL